VAFQVNERTENIGARRLHTVMERLLEKISYEAADKSGENYLIDAEHVDKNLGQPGAERGPQPLHPLISDRPVSQIVIYVLSSSGSLTSCKHRPDPLW
jgi:hypothetical protein